MIVVLAVAMVAALAVDGSAQVPDEVVTFRKATIWSEGTRMSAEVYAPRAAAADAKLPTIIMAHGWGGVAAQLWPDAIGFAKAGYLVVAFDYRGWGESDARVVLTGPEPAQRPDNKFTAEVLELREIVDPLAEAQDWFNAIAWVEGEPQSDHERIGLWGTSFAGALVVYVAGYDHRVKAVHSQVGPLDLRNPGSEGEQLSRDAATRRARGELGYPKPGAVVVGNLRGAPIGDHFLTFVPAEAMRLAPDCAFQVVLAGNEELFDNRRATIPAYEAFPGTKKNLVIIPDIKHYDIYGPAHAEAQRLALAWFEKYLKP
jgi:dienelactone hydrolase